MPIFNSLKLYLNPVDQPCRETFCKEYWYYVRLKRKDQKIIKAKYDTSYVELNFELTLSISYFLDPSISKI